MNQETCPDNTANIASVIISAGMLFISEILPFVKTPTNGIMHTIVTVLKAKFKINPETPQLQTEV